MATPMDPGFRRDDVLMPHRLTDDSKVITAFAGMTC
jgi:hypothetical protein